MPVESATYISQLNSSNPVASDGVAQGDDHLRLLKSAILATLPNWTATALSATQAALDAAAQAVVGTIALIMNAGSVTAPGIAVAGDPNTGIYSPGADQLSITTGGLAALKAKADQSVEVVGALVADSTVTATGAYAGGTGQLMPLGMAGVWFTDTLPAGNFQWCNGQAISRTTYAALFAILGTTWGAGDASTTFNLPDLRERAPLGKSTMGATSSQNRIPQYTTNALALTVGEAQHALITAELAAHTHTGTTGTESQSHTHSYTAPATTGGAQGGSGANQPTSTGGTTGTASQTHTHSFTSDSTGSGTAHNNVQPVLVCNWIMRIA